MVSDRIPIGGSMILWTIAPQSSLEVLANGLRALGKEQFTPEPRTPLACLKSALGEVYKPVEKGEKYTVDRANNGQPGFVVAVSRPKDEIHPEDTWSRVVVVAKLNEETGEVTLDPPDYDKRREVRERMAEAAKWVTAAAVAKVLTDVIESLHGVAIRPTGGVYWLNESEMEEFGEVARLVESVAGGDKETKVFTPHVVADDEMVRMVGVYLTEEVEAAVAKLERELAAGDLKEQGCLSRLREAGKLSEKVQRYEVSFNEPLVKLQEACQRAASAAAMAALQASAAQNPQPLLSGCK